MKLIIIEGVDNSGKSTIINQIKENNAHQRIKVIHCEKPKGTTFSEQAKYQDDYFFNLAKEIGNYAKDNLYDMIILDRSWYGEYVYGCLYRGRNDADVKRSILNAEVEAASHILAKNMYFISLTVSNPVFSVSKEDGLSISNGKIENIKKEIQRFTEIFEFSPIRNKIEVTVNNGLNFRSINDIMVEVNELLQN